jgi:hypothetical protein
MKSCHEVLFKVPQQRSAQINKWPLSVIHHAASAWHFFDVAQKKAACVSGFYWK